MKGDLRCTDGRLMRHDPQPDGPYLETDIGKCPECDGKGCCEECKGLTYVIREFGEIACPVCQPDAYEEQLRDTYLGY